MPARRSNDEVEQIAMSATLRVIGLPDAPPAENRRSPDPAATIPTQPLVVPASGGFSRLATLSPTERSSTCRSACSPAGQLRRHGVQLFWRPRAPAPERHGGVLPPRPCGCGLTVSAPRLRRSG